MADINTLSYGTVIPNMTTGLPKRVTGYLSGNGVINAKR